MSRPLRLRPSLPALAAALCVAPAAAQEPVPLVLEGDAVPAVGLVTRIDNLAVNDVLSWLAEVDTDNADTDTDGALVVDGDVDLREGGALAAPPGATLDSFDGLGLTNGGIVGANYFLDGTAGTFDDSGVYWDHALIVQESDIVDSPEVSPGTPYIGFFEVKTNEADQLLCMASIDDPAIPTTVDRALVVFQIVGGAYGGTDVRWKEGDVLPGQVEPIADFETGPHQMAVNAGGEVLFVADLAGDTAVDGAVYLDDLELAQEGDPSPVGGRSWLSLASAPVDVNDAGDHAYRGRLDGDTATDDLLVRNGAKLAQQGDVLAATGGFALESFGTGPVLIRDDGGVVWYGDWNDPDTSRDSGLFLDDELLVQEGVTTTTDGDVIAALASGQDAFALSPHGAQLVFEGTLDDGRDGVFRVDLPLGTRSCSPAVPNSTGASAVIHAYGSPIAGGNPLRLVATDLPPNEFGYFLLSETTAFVPNPGGSQGNLCLGGKIGRFVDQAQLSDPAGRLEIDVDTQDLPLPGTAVIRPGETWHFQAWFRDAPSSNFTDVVGVPFL